MFTKTLIFSFCFIGLFTVLVAAIPQGFYEYQAELQSSAGIPPEVASRLELANLTVYDTGATDNMVWDYTSLLDSPSPPNYLIAGTTDDFCEIWWSSVIGTRALQLRHATRKTIPWVYYDYHQMQIYFKNGTRIPQMVVGGSSIYKSTIDAAWDSSSNASAFYGECPHATFSVAFTIHNATRDATIGDAWDYGEMDYFLSYDRNWNATNISGITLLAQLMTFQNPDLGIPGFWGSVLNTMIAIPLWVIVAIALVKLIQSLIPFIRGVQE